MSLKHLVIMVLSAAVIMLPAVSAVAAPRLTLDENYYNFGYMPQYARVSHTFWLRSTGDSKLIINEVVPGCGCTQAPLDKDVVEVGDSAKLEIIFDSRRFKSRITKQPSIKTNGEIPETKIQIIATIVEKGDTTRPLHFEPFGVDFLGSNEEVLAPMEFKITNLSDAPLNITVLDKADDYFEIFLPSSIGPRETKTATVKLKKEVAPQAFYKSCTIQVNDEWSHRFSIPIARKKAGPPGVATGADAHGQ